MKCTCKKCHKDFDYKLNPGRQAKRNRRICPHCGYRNENPDFDPNRKKFVQTPNPVSLGPDAPNLGQQNAIETPNPAPPETPNQELPGNGESNTSRTFDTSILIQKGENHKEFYLPKDKCIEYFKAKKITPRDLAIVKFLMSDNPRFRKWQAEIARKMGKSPQFIEYRFKKIVKHYILIPNQDCPGSYKKNPYYLWWSIPELKVQILANKPILELKSPAKFEQEVIKSKARPKAKAPDRLDVEMHDPLFKLIPDDLIAFQKKTRNTPGISFHHNFSKNNDIYQIPDSVLDDFGLKILGRKDYWIRVYTQSLGAYIYSEDHDSLPLEVEDIKKRGEALKKKVQILYALGFHWEPSIEKTIEKHNISWVLKSSNRFKTPPASIPVVQALPIQPNNIQDSTQTFLQTPKQIPQQIIQNIVKIGPDGSDPNGLEGKSPLVFDIAEQYNKIGALEQKVNNLPTMVKDTVKEVIIQIMPELARTMANEMVKAFQQPASRPKLAPLGEYT